MSIHTSPHGEWKVITGGLYTVIADVGTHCVTFDKYDTVENGERGGIRGRLSTPATTINYEDLAEVLRDAGYNVEREDS